MSINFHANQYEQAFTPHKTQNWEVPKNEEGKYPEKRAGFTRVKANDRGHLLPNVPRERTSPWGTYVGTWDMPTKIPGNRVTNPTARCEEAVIKGTKDKVDAGVVLSGALKRCHTVEPLPVKMDAPDDQMPAGMVCEPVNGPGAAATYMEPCPQMETTTYASNQPRVGSRKGSSQSLQWPQTKTPGCQSPVGHAQSPKPVTPMAVADQDVQDRAKKAVSPLAPVKKNAEIGALNTPDADLQRRADKPPTPEDRIVGMKSPAPVPVDGTNPHAEAALVS